MKGNILTILTLALCLSAAAQADYGDPCNSAPTVADGNGIFQPGGERPGSNYYFNVEGANNGSYASWAAAEWTSLDLPVCDEGYECDIHTVRVCLVQSNAGFTTNGAVKMYLAPDYVQAHEGGAHNYNDWFASIEGDSTHLLDYNFVETSTGDENCYAITDPAAVDAIVDSLRDGKLVLAFVEGDANVAATYAGIGSFYGHGPQITLEGTCVPEPTTMGLLGVGAVGALIKRKRNA